MSNISDHPLDRAAKAVGSAAALARLIGISRSALSQYKDPGRKVKAEHCPVIERATRQAGFPVTCEELRADVDWQVLRENGSTGQIGESDVHESDATANTSKPKGLSDGQFKVTA